MKQTNLTSSLRKAVDNGQYATYPRPRAGRYLPADKKPVEFITKQAKLIDGATKNHDIDGIIAMLAVADNVVDRVYYMNVFFKKVMELRAYALEEQGATPLLTDEQVESLTAVMFEMIRLTDGQLFVYKTWYDQFYVAVNFETTLRIYRYLVTANSFSKEDVKRHIEKANAWWNGEGQIGHSRQSYYCFANQKQFVTESVRKAYLPLFRVLYLKLYGIAREQELFIESRYYEKNQLETTFKALRPETKASEALAKMAGVNLTIKKQG